MLHISWWVQTLVTSMPSPSMVTCLAFYPEDNNILLVGLDDSSILVYHIHKEQVYLSLSSFKKDMMCIIDYMFKGYHSFIYVRFKSSLRATLNELLLLPSQILWMFLFLVMQMLRLVYNIFIPHIMLITSAILELAPLFPWTV